ncbi:hypothetical protein ROLI_001610 [Roseobacter fucihabitans]|uniref:Uncharacterized protein n=1 Tax=Roseobacter fucihabitans TaxID=1537242 RepID=A0ABZ2BP35_9RHOB|nr:hypothetical protein [Roseobacter litoralis]MBC6963411.1 hypothetical protein [Roseobacter litoralis]
MTPLRPTARPLRAGGRRLCLTWTVLAVALAGCGPIEAFKASAVGERLGLAPITPCDVSKLEGKRLIGAYLRQVTVTQGFEMFSITGVPRSTGLPRNLDFDDSKIRRLSLSPDGALTGSRRSTITAREGFPKTATLPAVYDMTYRAERIDYTGPMVVGTSATGFEIPTTGRALYGGTVQLSMTRFLEDGSVQTSDSTGRFTVDIGYGSGRARFDVSALETTEGAALPFDRLTWANLGVCGTRVISSGQGNVKTISAEGRASSPFVIGRALAPARSNFESMQFANQERPAPPGAYGGIFSIESDIGTLSAVFLSDNSP